MLLGEAEIREHNVPCTALNKVKMIEVVIKEREGCGRERESAVRGDTELRDARKAVYAFQEKRQLHEGAGVSTKGRGRWGVKKGKG